MPEILPAETNARMEVSAFEQEHVEQRGGHVTLHVTVRVSEGGLLFRSK
jgi:hypothetical protein